MPVISRMCWNGAAVVDRRGPGDSWRIRMTNADQQFVVEGMTTTAMVELARQINRAIREAKQLQKELA